VQINCLFYVLLAFFETPWWWSRVRPKHDDDYQYV